MKGRGWLTHEGEMAGLIRAHDWARSAMGPASAWPPYLRAFVAFILHSARPLALIWGADGVMLYNDSFAAIAGRRHPALLGARMREAWPEVGGWSTRILRAVLRGRTVDVRDQKFVLDRRGGAAPAWFDLEFSPVFDERGLPACVLLRATETTERVRADEARRANEADLREVRRSGERLWQLAFDRFRLGAWSWDLRNRRMSSSEQMHGLFGVPAEPRWLPVSAYTDLMAPQSRAAVDALMASDPRPGAAVDAVVRMSAGPAAGRWIEMRGRAEPNCPSMVHGISLDVTERRLLENRFRDGQTRFRAFLSASTDVVYRMSPDWREMRQLDGRGFLSDTVEADAMWFDRYIHPDDQAAVAQAIDEAIAARRMFVLEHRVLRADGRLGWTYSRAVPIVDDAGEIVEWFGAAIDVTDRHEAEERLHASEAHQAFLLELSDALRPLSDAAEIECVAAGMIAAHLRGATVESLELGHDGAADRLLDVLAAMDELRCGRSVAVPSVASDPRLPPGDKATCARNGVASFMAVPIVEEGRMTAVFAAHGRHPRLWKAEELTLLESVAERMLGAIDRVRFEAQLAEYQRMEALGRLTGGVAHDFNNLLIVILGNLELIQAKGGADVTEGLIREAIEAVETGASLTGQLLSFARQRTLSSEQMRLNDRVGATAQLLSRTLGEAIVVETRLDEAAGLVRADPAALDNAILNVAVNARDAMPGGGSLMLATTTTVLDGRRAAAAAVPPGRYACLSMTDTGSGMSPDVLRRAFEPFFTTKKPHKGTGLGLSSVYGFARQSGGFVEIESELGRGTTLRLYLPRVAEPVPDIACPPLPDGPDGEAQLILLVEDNDSVRRLTRRRLEALGHAVVDAASGPEALSILEQRSDIGLVLSDVVMPGGMSGFDVARWVRTHRPGIGVLLASGHHEVLNHTYHDASVRVLAKPFSMATLADALRGALQAGPVPAISGGAADHA